jgi:hypothetical protein
MWVYVYVYGSRSRARIPPAVRTLVGATLASVDVNDTSARPRKHRCESCGSATDDLEVVALKVLSEVICLTMCKLCRGSGHLPSIMLSTAEKLAAQHSEHVQGVKPTYRTRPQ